MAPSGVSFWKQDVSWQLKIQISFHINLQHLYSSVINAFLLSFQTTSQFEWHIKYLYNICKYIIQDPFTVLCWYYKIGTIKQVLLSRQEQTQLGKQTASYLPGTAARAGPQAIWTLTTVLFSFTSLWLICPLHSLDGQILPEPLLSCTMLLPLGTAVLVEAKTGCGPVGIQSHGAGVEDNAGFPYPWKGWLQSVGPTMARRSCSKTSRALRRKLPQPLGSLPQSAPVLRVWAGDTYLGELLLGKVSERWNYNFVSI